MKLYLRYLLNPGAFYRSLTNNYEKIIRSEIFEPTTMTEAQLISLAQNLLEAKTRSNPTFVVLMTWFLIVTAALLVGATVFFGPTP